MHSFYTVYWRTQRENVLEARFQATHLDCLTWGYRHNETLRINRKKNKLNGYSTEEKQGKKGKLIIINELE